MNIKKAGVIGSGVMGSGIAAHLANAGIETVLLDIVPKDAKDRSVLAKTAIEKGLEAKIPAFTHKRNAKRVTPGNMEDDLGLLADCDWIVEVVIERKDIKHEVYKKIDSVRKAGSVVSSNTSTIPLHELTEGMSEQFKKDFMITHFFNPPRFMRLLEVVKGSVRDDAWDAVRGFADKTIGKGVVECKDTPGFIANRIGVYWLTAGLVDAIELGISVEDADAVMGKPVGFPKTGVFGLFDLIGIDLMPLIAKELVETLPKDDPFHTLYDEPELVKKMIADGYTGRKGKGGFYRINKEGGGKVKEVIDLQSGAYHPAGKSRLDSVAAARGGLRALVEHDDIGGQYTRAVLLKTLHYAASLIPEISDDIVSVDNAMKWGYNWKYGPFELIDRLGTSEQSGTAWFAEYCSQQGWQVPGIIEAASGQPLYRLEQQAREYATLGGGYHKIKKPEGVWELADIKLGAKPVKKNGSSALWDVGDGVLCLEFTSKMNSIDPDILTMMTEAVEIVQREHAGLIIGGDGDNFSVGANLGFFLYACNVGAWGMMSDAIRQGQNAVMGLKYAPFPVVVALHGMALGGGCETTLHADAVQAHIESYPGLVEVGVGVIPGWGGCKEMLVRHLGREKQGFGGAMPKVKTVFELIGMAKVGGSAEEARDMLILNDKSRITMNRARLLADAKELCLNLAQGYRPPEPAKLKLPGKSGKVAIDMVLKGFAAVGKLTPHDKVVTSHLATVLTGGSAADSSRELSEQDLLDLEHEHFMELIKTKATLDRIEHMLETGKPLRN